LYGWTSGEKTYHEVEIDTDAKGPLGIERTVVQRMGTTYGIRGAGSLHVDASREGPTGEGGICAVIRVVMQGNARTKLAPTPNINYQLNFSLYLDANNKVISAWLDGAHDGFPSYEAHYNGAKKYDFHETPPTGGGILSLFGTSDISVHQKLHP
jgi:hypothetical protein